MSEKFCEIKFNKDGYHDGEKMGMEKDSDHVISNEGEKEYVHTSQSFFWAFLPLNDHCSHVTSTAC